MKVFLSFIVTLLGLSTGLTAPAHGIYVKGGADYLWRGSQAYAIKRIHPIQNTLPVTLTHTSIDGSELTGNIALGMSYTVNPDWRVSPEVSYIPVTGYTKTVSPFILVPNGLPPVTDTFYSSVSANVIIGSLNIDYLLSQKAMLYLTPGLGMGFIKTTNTLTYQAANDETQFLMTSNERQNNFSFQIVGGIKYEVRPSLFLDIGMNYIWLGKIPLGNYSMDVNQYNRTDISAHSTYAFGPRLNLVFYMY